MEQSSMRLLKLLKSRNIFKRLVSLSPVDLEYIYVHSKVFILLNLRLVEYVDDTAVFISVEYPYFFFSLSLSFRGNYEHTIMDIFVMDVKICVSFHLL